ncbi:ABC transporter ATP-binding protein [Trichothermofontia sp.]
MNNSIAFSLNHVSKVFANGTVALQDMHLTVQASQFISLVGPSGCGKSTVLRLVAGLSGLSTGRIEWGSDSPTPSHHRAQSPQNLAFVFQESALMPWATVLDNVCLPLKLSGMSRRSAQIAAQEALHLVGLTGWDRHYPRELSGGMKMRVSIARALVTQPNLLLMDEPFGALDEITRSKLNNDVLELWQQKRWTVLFVTHNIYEAVYLSQRVIVMAPRPGRVIADVTIDAPYPRTEAFRTSEICNQYCREVSAHLSEAMQPPRTGTALSPVA